MRKLLLFLTLFFPLTAAAQTKESISGYCERGGETVTTDGRQSTTRVQRSFSSCTITVYYAGTNQLATVYPSSTSSSAKSNPFIADTDGYWQFYALPGRYDVRFSGTGITTPFTRAGYWISQGGGSSVPTCTTSQLLYYAATGSTPICLTLGTNLSITSGVLNAAGGGGSTGSGTVGEGNRFQFAYYSSSGTTVGGYPYFTATNLGGINYFDFVGPIRSVRTVSNPFISSDSSILSDFTLANSQASSTVLAAIRANLSVTSGTYNADSSGYLSNLTAGVNTTVNLFNGYLSRIQGSGASGSVWSGFRAAYSHNSNTVPGSVNSFYSEPPAITLGTLPTFTAFHAVAPASLSNITNYRAFYSSGGSSQFQKTFATDAVQYLNGMTAQFFAPNSNAFAAWGFNPPTTPVGSYTYLFPNSIPLANQYLTVGSIDASNVQLQWTNAAASGSVTEVGLAAPDIFTVTGSPVTTSGTLTLNLASQATPNRVFASPNGSTGKPSFRSLVSADIPNLSSIYQTASATLSQFAGLNPADKDLIQYNSGAWTTRTPAQIKSDLQLNNVENVALSTWAGSTNLTTFGTISAGTWQGSVIESSKGGAGTVNGIMKANGAGVVSAATAGTDYEVPITASTGLTRTVNAFSVNTTQNISRLSNLTTNGLVKTTLGDGTLAIATSGTDYAPATVGNSILYANGMGGFSPVSIGSGLNFVGGQLFSTSAGGSVTSVSITPANGFSGSVLNPSSTPAITLSTPVTGLLKGSGGAITSASATSDYVAPGSFLTSGLTLNAGTFLIGRTSASAGAPQQFNVGTGLQIVAGSALQTNPVQDNITTLSTLASANDGYVKASTTGLLSKVSNATLTSELDVFTSSLKGAVPASGGGTANFLRADGTWAAPPSGGGGGTGSTGNGFIPYNSSGTFISSPLSVVSASILNNRENTSASTINTSLTLQSTFPTTVSNGFGNSLDFNLKPADLSPVLAGRVSTSWELATSASYTSYMDFTVHQGGTTGAPIRQLRVTPTSVDIGTSDYAYPGRLRVFSDPTKYSAVLLPSLDVMLNSPDSSGRNGLLLAHNPTNKTYSNGTGFWWMPKQGDPLSNAQGLWFSEATIDGSTLYGIGFRGPAVSNRYWFYNNSGNVVFDIRPDDRFINFRPVAGDLSGLRFWDGANDNWVGLTGPAATGVNLTYKFPSAGPVGSNVDGYDVLTASTTGQMVWKTATGTGNVMYSNAPTLTSQLWTAISSVTYTVGTVIYCSNCTPGSCSVTGNGALAVYTSAGWACK